MSKNETEPKRFLSKKRLKQALMLVSILLMSLVLSGCENFVETDVNAETKSIIQTVSETTNTANIAEIKTIEPPEDGWTWERLSEVVYINGIKYDYPITLGALTETYTYDKNIVYNDNAGTILYYNNIYAFGAGIEYDNIGDIDENSKIVSAIFNILEDESQINSSELIWINGIRLGDSYEKMIVNLGTPDIINDDFSYKYVIDNKIALVVYFFYENEIQTIQLSWEE